jgi:hypothetical protein
MKALLSLLLLCSACAFGQRKIDVDNEVMMQTGAFFQAVSGAPVSVNIYYKVVEGSAYFNLEWQKGAVSLDGQKDYGNLWLRLDLLANELHFRDNKGEEMICASPINRIILTDATTGRRHSFVHSSFIAEMASFKPETWLEAMVQGRAGLYTQHKKSIQEIRPYGSATLEQHIVTIDMTYLVFNNQYIRVKRPSDITSALSDQIAELQDWLKKNDIDPKNPADLGRLVEAYNNLFPKL